MFALLLSYYSIECVACFVSIMMTIKVIVDDGVFSAVVVGQLSLQLVSRLSLVVLLLFLLQTGFAIFSLFGHNRNLLVRSFVRSFFHYYLLLSWASYSTLAALKFILTRFLSSSSSLSRRAV